MVSKLPEFLDHCSPVWWENKLTGTTSTWLSPRPVRKTVDELKTLQIKSSEAPKLLILTKVIIQLWFLPEVVVKLINTRNKYTNINPPGHLYFSFHSISTLLQLILNFFLFCLISSLHLFPPFSWIFSFFSFIPHFLCSLYAFLWHSIA